MSYRSFIKISILLIILLGVTSCGASNYYSPLDSYVSGKNITNRIYDKNEIDEILGSYREDAARAADFIFHKMLTNGKATIVMLGHGLSRLPDLNDGISEKEIQALMSIFELAVSVNKRDRLFLANMADENNRPYQFSGSLQGLLWMFENNDFKYSYLSRRERSVFRDYAWQEAPKRCKTPEQALHYLTTNYSYIMNRYTSQTCREFFDKKFGDCTEFSLLAGRLLNNMGYEVHILLTRPSPTIGHASVIFSKGVDLWLFDASRIATVNVLKKKINKGQLEPGDRLVWDAMNGIDRIIGPVYKLDELISRYRGADGKNVRYSVIDYQRFSRFIEENGREDFGWWKF